MIGVGDGDGDPRRSVSNAHRIGGITGGGDVNSQKCEVKKLQYNYLPASKKRPALKKRPSNHMASFGV